MDCQLKITSPQRSPAFSNILPFSSSRTPSPRRAAVYSHLLYSAPQSRCHSLDSESYTNEESRFSSCSTSPSSSCESLDHFAEEGSRRSKDSDLSLTAPSLSTPIPSSCSDARLRSTSCSSGRFVDDHYPLITNVSATKKGIHASVMEMAHAYNTYIRAINSCYNHASSLGDEEVRDYLFFSQTLFNVLSKHFKADYHYLQPLLHIPSEPPYLPTRRISSIHDDFTFQNSFHAWAKCIHDTTTSRSFCGQEVQAHISTFAPLFVQHLHDEVSLLNGLVSEDILMPQHLSKIWSRFEETMADSLDLYTDAALLIGCHDRNSSINGQRAEQKFPRLARGSTTMIKKWHSRRHDGAWRFCSSDFSGRRRYMSV